MRKIILALLGAIAMSSTYAQNWLPIRYENQNVKGIPFSKVRFKKGETKETIFGKDMQVTLSEKPDGVESGYYVVHARNGYIAIGDKKNKIEVGSDKLIRTSDGWYEYDFGKTLYVRKIGMFVGTEHCAPIYVLSTDGSVASSSSSSSYSSSSNTSNSSTIQKQVSNKQGTTVNRKLEILSPSNGLTDDGWSLSKTNVKDGITCETYVKEIDDEELFLYHYKRENGDFLISDKEINLNDINALGNKKDFFISGIYGYSDLLGGKYNYKWHDSEGVLHVYQKNPYRQQLFYPNGMVIDKTKEQTYLYLPDNLNVGYLCVDLKKDYFWSTWMEGGYHDLSGIERSSGFLVGDRFYRCYSSSSSDENNVIFEPTPVLQLIKGKFFIVCPTDTIVDVKYVSTKDTTINEQKLQEYTSCEVFYKNGDRYKYVKKHPDGGYSDWYQIATLHRMDGVLKITKKGTTFTKNDGTVIQVDRLHNREGRGQTANAALCDQEELVYWLSEDSLTFSGNVTYPDGTTDKLDRGESGSYLKSLAKEEEKKKEAEKQAIRNSYIKKYGYYPGDYDKREDFLKPGRKFGAIEEYTTVSLVSTNGLYKRYKVFYGSYAGTQYAYVWVKNGIITSVTY